VATQTNHVQVNGQTLHEVSTVAALTSGTYLAQAKETVLAFDLAQGTTTIIIA
jgi:archaellum component FlaF (FlaF/FlaG flagellin family)